MTKIKDLSQGNLGDIARQQHRDRYATPLNGSSVGTGGQRFYGTGKLTVENEGLYVNGTANISGALDVSGTLNVTGTSTFTGETNLNGPTDVAGTFTVTGDTSLGGPTTITGTLDVTGVTSLDGDTTVSGTLDVTGAMATKGTLSVEGVTTLKNDLDITTGKINVGQLQIEPAGGGQLNFTDGAISRSSTFGMLVNDGLAVELAAPTVKLTGTAVIVSGLPTTTQPANLHIDGSGRLFRSTAV